MILARIEEKLKRPGLLGRIGKQHENQLAKHLESYFRVLGRKVAALHLPQMAQVHDKKLVRHAVEMRLHNTLRTLSPLLKSTLQTAIHDAVLASNKIHHFSEADEDPTAGDNVIVAEQAQQYAAQQAGELVTGINDTSQQMIADAIEQGIDQQLGVQGTAGLLSDLFDSFSNYRSRLIATTEMNDAMSEGMLIKLGALGVAYKQWIAATACCDACADNDDASPIPIDDVFPSGDDRPPAHPNCRCALAGARAPESA